MNFKNILWGVARQDGTRDVKVYVYFQGKVKYYSTGLKVLEQDWNDKTGYVKNSHPLAKTYNAKIRALRNKVEDHFLSGGTFTDFQSGKDPDKHALVPFLTKFVADGENGMLGLREGTLKNYRATLKRLEQYEGLTGKKLFFTDITLEFERDFGAFLRNHADCKLPGISKHIKNIKRVMATAQEQGLHRNEAYREFKVHKSTRSHKIFLTKEEIERLETMDLSAQPTLEVERDRFLLSYYFVLRFSDVTQLKRANIFVRDGQTFLHYKSVKTGQEAILPASQKALVILEKYDYQMDFSTNQQANRELKKICALTGIIPIKLSKPAS